MMTRFSTGMLVAALLMGLLTVPVNSQDDSTDQEALNLLKSAAEKSLNSSSYTMSIDQNVKQKQSLSNLTINQKTFSAVKFEQPYIYINMNSETEGVGGQGKNKSDTKELIGKQNDNNELSALFQKTKGPGGWKRMDQNQSVNFKKMYNRFRSPDKLSEHLKNVQFDGEETVNGTSCRKITAEQKASAIESAAKEMMKGSGGKNKMLENMDISVDVEKSDMNIWIRKDSSLIEKISLDTKQKVNMKMNLRGTERSFSMEQDLNMESTFKDYGSTSVPQKYKDKLDELLSK